MLALPTPARGGIKITPDIAEPEAVDTAARSRSTFDADEAEQPDLPQCEAAGAVDMPHCRSMSLKLIAATPPPCVTLLSIRARTRRPDGDNAA